MKEYTAQFDKSYRIEPFSQEDLEIAKNFKQNQIVRVKVYGTKKERSLIQLKMYWALCKVVADNTENEHWNTKEKVDFQCRIKTQFINTETAIVSNDKIVFEYRSIAFKNLGHIEACNYFDRAYDVMADFLGTTKEQLKRIGYTGIF